MDGGAARALVGETREIIPCLAFPLCNARPILARRQINTANQAIYCAVLRNYAYVQTNHVMMYITPLTCSSGPQAWRGANTMVTSGHRLVTGHRSNL